MIAFDAPLYALAKFVQWNWPQSHGESQYVVMFGGLHVEMAMWTTFGDYLEASGWTTALNQAGIASSGTCRLFSQSVPPHQDETCTPTKCSCFEQATA